VGNLHSEFEHGSLRVLELFAMYATDGQTDGRTKATVIAPFPTGGGIKKILFKMRLTDVLQICF